MLRSRGSRAITATVLGLGAVFLGAPVNAEQIINLPVNEVHYGAEGSVKTIASKPVPEDYIGKTCTITGKTSNGESVHAGNDLLIVAGDQTITISDIESGEYASKEMGDIEVVPATIELQVRFGPDGVTSGGYSVSIACDTATTTTTEAVAEPTTTTTEAEAAAETTTTTEAEAAAETTTTEAVVETTTTTEAEAAAETTTTTEAVDQPTTTNAELQETTTTLEETTSSSAQVLGPIILGPSTTTSSTPDPMGPMITAGPVSNNSQAAASSSLPVTGNDYVAWALGISLVIAGGFLVNAARKMTN